MTVYTILPTNTEYQWNPDKPAAPCDDIPGCDTVGHRADIAMTGLKAMHPVLYGLLDADPDMETVSDSITDFLHLCDKHGIDPQKVISRAIKNWEVER